jgi:hypothetical protein
MEISASTALNHLPARAVGQRAAGGDAGAAVRARGEPGLRADGQATTDPDSREFQRTLAQPAVSYSPAQETEKLAGFRFEYEDNVQVMKVQDSKGVLIYQVPSKGRLALIETEESGQSAQLRQTA